jgi:RNA recognition motif-containing protein
MKSIYVENLSRSDTTLDDLENLFASFGIIKKASLVTHPLTGLSEGYAFVDFEKVEAATAALSQNGKEFQNRILKVSLAPYDMATSSGDDLLEDIHHGEY